MLIVCLLTSQVLTAATRRAVDRQSGGEASWVTRASLTATEMGLAISQAAAAEATATRPVVLIETNYYTYLPGQTLQLRITTDSNGFAAPVTMYVYWENRSSGERRYYNASSRALLPPGQQADLFGAAGSPAAIMVPKLNDFVLFGTAGDATNSWGVDGALGGSITVPSAQAGLYQYVLELRDATGKRVISRSNAMYSYVEQSVDVSSTITSSTTWTANKRYVLHDFVGVQAPAVLTIEPGTVIYGGDTRATLFIQAGAKIVADGTARRPIIFTSAQAVGGRAQKDWGSLVVLGRSPINSTGGVAVMEGLPSQPQYQYGGNDPNDSSGVLRYVRLEFGGFEIEANQEINGLTLGGVGKGTVVDYVEVLHNKDDAFEFFGGTVDARHLLGVAFADDGLDFDNGYSGRIQYAAMIKRAVNDENDGNILSESDNHASLFDLTPTTAPRVYNVTGVRVNGPAGNFGAVLRRGTAGRFYNAIITGSRQAPVTVRDTATLNNINAGTLAVDNSILHGDFTKYPNTTEAANANTFLFTTMKGNRNVDPMLAIGAPTALQTLMPDLTPLAGSSALDVDYVAQPPDDGFFDRTDFIGAVGPGNNWVLSGWATFSDN